MRENIYERGRREKNEPVDAGDSVHLALKQRTFRKETYPTYDAELHKVDKNNHDVRMSLTVNYILEKIFKLSAAR